jgi:hypothetical protein
MIVSQSSEVVAPSCLVCGALSPSLAEARGRRRGSLAQLLHELGWYSWRGEQFRPWGRQEPLLSCLCPECLLHPDRVAKSIIERHGLAPMVEWLRGWQAAAN